jgi:hypothetical protein
MKTNTPVDEAIDQLMAERRAAEAAGLRQNARDAALLLAFLLEDVKRNPKNYIP